MFTQASSDVVALDRRGNPVSAAWKTHQDRTIFVSSALRDRSLFPRASEFDVVLDDPMRNVSSVSLTYAAVDVPDDYEHAWFSVHLGGMDNVSLAAPIPRQRAWPTRSLPVTGVQGSQVSGPDFSAVEVGATVRIQRTHRVVAAQQDRLTLEPPPPPGAASLRFANPAVGDGRIVTGDFADVHPEDVLAAEGGRFRVVERRSDAQVVVDSDWVGAQPYVLEPFAPSVDAQNAFAVVPCLRGVQGKSPFTAWTHDLESNVPMRRLRLSLRDPTGAPLRLRRDDAVRMTLVLRGSA